MIMTSREPEPIAHNASHSGLHKTPSIDSSSPTTQLLQRSNNGSTRSTGSTRSNVKCVRRDNGESDSDSPTVGLKNSRSTLPQDAMVPEELPPALALLGDTPILQDMIMSRDVGDLRRSRGSDDNGSPNQSPSRNQSGTASPITANLKKPDDSVNVNVINNLMPSSRKRARSDCRSQENSGAVTPTEVTVTQLMPMAAADDQSQSQSQSQSQNQTLELQDPPGPSRHIFLTVNQTNVSELELSEKLAAVSQVDENGNRKKRRRHRRNHSSHSCQSCQKKGHRRKESKNSYKESSPNKAARGRTEEGVRTKQILLSSNKNANNNTLAVGGSHRRNDSKNSNLSSNSKQSSMSTRQVLEIPTTSLASASQKLIVKYPEKTPDQMEEEKKKKQKAYVIYVAILFVITSVVILILVLLSSN